MKLTRSETKIPLNSDNLKSLLGYLNLIGNTNEYYIEGLKCDFLYKHLITHNIQTIAEKIISLLYRSTLLKKNYTLKLTHSEKITLLILLSVYPLPNDILFIELYTNKNIITNEY